jgi:hypothetical protein
VYVTLVLITVLMSFYLSLKGGILLNTAILIGAVYWACLEFGKKNKRYFSKNEKMAVILGIIAVDLCLQFSLSLIAIYLGKSSIGFIRQVIFGLLLVCSLHALVIYHFVRSNEKFIAKKKMLGGYRHSRGTR